MCWEPDSNPSAGCRPLRPSASLERDRIAQIASIRAEIKKLRREKKTIENKISDAWKRAEDICGHPRVRITSWSTSECTDCGYFARTKYFWDRGSTVIDVDGQEKRKDKL